MSEDIEQYPFPKSYTPSLFVTCLVVIGPALDFLSFFSFYSAACYLNILLNTHPRETGVPLYLSAFCLIQPSA
jgi:hypothetical protein